MSNTNTVKTRGRPRKFNRQKGIEICEGLFWKYGYEGLGVAEICSTLKITPTSLYGTFQSKFKLFEEVLQQYTTQYQQGLMKILADSHSVADVFRGVLEFSLAQYTKNETTPGCLLLESSSYSKKSEVLALNKQEITQIEALIFKKLDELNAKNAVELASIIITLLRGLSSEAKAGKSEDDLFVTLEFLCAAFDC